jgi:hypothetical protein
MSVTTSALYGGRWGVFALRYALYQLYNVAAFTTKPGSRTICPAMAAAAVYVWRLPLDAEVRRYVLDVDWRQMPEPVTMEAAGAACLALMVCVGVVVVPRLPQEGTAASALMRFFLRLALLLAAISGMAWYAGYRPPANFMAVYAPWLTWQPTLADAALIFALVAASFLYSVASRLGSLVLGALPVATHPLRPLKPLKATSSVRKPARLRVVVPSLPPTLG